MSYLAFITDGVYPLLYLGVFAVTFVICWVVIANSSSFISARGHTSDLTAPQNSHTLPTPRAAVLACLGAQLAFIPIASITDLEITQNISFSVATVCIFIAAQIPLILVGALEDFGIHQSPRNRLAGIVLSVALVIAMFGVMIDRSDIGFIDDLLSFKIVAALFTLFAVTGVVNAFNLIDGLNGLLGFTALTTATALGIAAFALGKPDLSIISMMFTSSVLAFLVVNYPSGRIFMGDGGAYVLGFILSWLAITLLHQTTVSPFALLLIFYWPIFDTLLAIWRRACRRSSAVRPDRMHCHQVMMRVLMIKTGLSKKAANPVATACLLPAIIAPQVVGVVFLEDTLVAGSSMLTHLGALLCSLQVGCGDLWGPIKRRYGEKYSEFSETIKKEQICCSNSLTFWEKNLNRHLVKGN